MSNSPKTYHFAVGVDKPLFATLEEYGIDGGEMHYFWLLQGKMGENLCEGLEAAKKEAERLGWSFHSFASHGEAVAAAKAKAALNQLCEASNLFWVALTMAEHFEGSTSKAYMDICKDFSPVARTMGNAKLADDLLKFLE